MGEVFALGGRSQLTAGPVCRLGGLHRPKRILKANKLVDDWANLERAGAEAPWDV